MYFTLACSHNTVDQGYCVLKYTSQKNLNKSLILEVWFGKSALIGRRSDRSPLEALLHTATVNDPWKEEINWMDKDQYTTPCFCRPVSLYFVHCYISTFHVLFLFIREPVGESVKSTLMACLFSQYLQYPQHLKWSDKCRRQSKFSCIFISTHFMSPVSWWLDLSQHVMSDNQNCGWRDWRKTRIWLLAFNLCFPFPCS